MFVKCIGDSLSVRHSPVGHMTVAYIRSSSSIVPIGCTSSFAIKKAGLTLPTN